MNPEYVQINAQGMTFGRSPRSGGDYEFGSIHPVTKLNIDEKSLKEWTDNKTLLPKTKEDYLSSVGKGATKKAEDKVKELIEEDIPDITTSPEEFNDTKGVDHAELRDGKGIDEYWGYAKKVGARKRKCPQENCKAGGDGKPGVYSNRLDLFKCDCKEPESEEE